MCTSRSVSPIFLVPGLCTVSCCLVEVQLFTCHNIANAAWAPKFCRASTRTATCFERPKSLTYEENLNAWLHLIRQKGGALVVLRVCKAQLRHLSVSRS